MRWSVVRAPGLRGIVSLPFSKSAIVHEQGGGPLVRIRSASPSFLITQFFSILACCAARPNWWIMSPSTTASGFGPVDVGAAGYGRLPVDEESSGRYWTAMVAVVVIATTSTARTIQRF